MGVHQDGGGVAAPIVGPRAAPRAVPNVAELGAFRAFMGNMALRAGNGRADGPFGVIRIDVRRAGGGVGGVVVGGGNDRPHVAMPHLEPNPMAGGLGVVFRVRGPGEPAVGGHRPMRAAMHGNDDGPRDPRHLHAPPPPLHDRRMDLVDALNDAVRGGHVDANMAHVDANMAVEFRDLFGIEDDDDSDDNDSDDDEWSHRFNVGDYDACSDVDVDDMDDP